MKISDESKRWVELNIIDETARENILALYEKKRSLNPIYVLFAVLGSLLLGLGVILIFATNWDNIPKILKLCIAFLPLITAICIFLFTLIKKRGSAAFCEGASLGLCLSVFATVALVGQVFHIPSDIAEYIRLCMFLSLPAVYLLEAKSAATVYVICVIWSGAGDVFPVWLLSALAIAPFFVLQIKKTGQKPAILYLSLLSGALLAFLIFKLPGEWVKPAVKFLSVAVILPALDGFIKRGKKINGAMPLTMLSSLTVIFMLMLSSFRGLPLYSFTEHPKSIILLAFAVIIYAAVRFYKQDFNIKTPDAVMLCALLGFPMFWLWSNVLLAALGIWLIFNGVTGYSLKLVNGGMLLLIFVIIARFFDSDLGLMERGIAFVLIGAGFIVTNLLLYKKWRVR